jgi:hypothetical protein
MLKCKHQCHCICSLEIGTCTINDAGRQAAQGVLDTTLCDKICHLLATSRWFSPGTPPIKCHDITEILFKVALNTITIPHPTHLYK